MMFSDVIISAIEKMISNPYTQHIIKGFLDISLQAIIFCFDLSDKPLVIAWMLCLTIE